MLAQIDCINRELNRIFPNGNDPFQIMTRLLEECGELAQQVNHFEATGIKREKHGEPSREKMAKEVQDVLRCVFQLVDYYELGDALSASIAKSAQSVGCSADC